jgi:integrase
MAERSLNDTLARKLPGPPPGRKKVRYPDARDLGLMLQVTSTDSRAWVFRYTIKGWPRELTIGDIEAWPIEQVRKEVHRLRRMVDQDEDPLVKRQEARDALTIYDLADRFRGNDGGDGNKRPRRDPSQEWLGLRPGTQKMYNTYLDNHVLPKWGRRKAIDIKKAEIIPWFNGICEHGFQGGRWGNEPHRRVPHAANEALHGLWHLYTLAGPEHWDVLDIKNPRKGIKFYPEVERQNFLKPDDKTALLKAIFDLKDDPKTTWAHRRNCRIILILLLTGARSGEVCKMRLDQLGTDAEGRMTWTKLPTDTKQKRLHAPPVSQAVADLTNEALNETPQPYSRKTGFVLRRTQPIPPKQRLRTPGKFKAVCEFCGDDFTATKPSQYCSYSCCKEHHRWQRRKVVAMPSKRFYVFPGARDGDPTPEPDMTWKLLKKITGITGYRIHDLRHTFASYLASLGYSLLMIGEHLGHVKPETTKRYARLLREPQQNAVEDLAKVVGLDNFRKRG